MQSHVSAVTSHRCPILTLRRSTTAQDRRCCFHFHSPSPLHPKLFWLPLARKPTEAKYPPGMTRKLLEHKGSPSRFSETAVSGQLDVIAGAGGETSFQTISYRFSLFTANRPPRAIITLVLEMHFSHYAALGLWHHDPTIATTHQRTGCMSIFRWRKFSYRHRPNPKDWTLGSVGIWSGGVGRYGWR